MEWTAAWRLLDAQHSRFNSRAPTHPNPTHCLPFTAVCITTHQCRPHSRTNSHRRIHTHYAANRHPCITPALSPRVARSLSATLLARPGWLVWGVLGAALQCRLLAWLFCCGCAAIGADGGLVDSVRELPAGRLAEHRCAGSQSYVVLFFVPPHHRLITSNTDPSLSYPYETDTVSAALLFFFAVGVPLLTFGVFFWLRRGSAHAKSEYHSLLLAFFLCIILNLLVTDSIKKLTGRPRPNFFALTRWQWHEASGVWGPGDDAPASDVREAYQSFVSGHTSLSFAGLLFLAQFLFQQLSPLSPLHIAQSIAVDRKRLSQLSRINNLPSLFIPFLPVALAVWIALTRIRDYWHFCEDVLGGVLVGSFLASVVFDYCYLERRWTWLNIHPAPGAEGFISPAGGAATDDDFLLSRDNNNSGSSSDFIHAPLTAGQHGKDSGVGGDRSSTSSLASSMV